MSSSPDRSDERLDPILGALARETDPARREQSIGALLEGVTGVIERTLQRKLRWPLRGQLSHETAEDIRSNVLLRLLKRMRTIGIAGDEPIANVAAYASVVTMNVCDDVLREMFPQRALLKNRIRYLLMRDSRFALWLSGDRWLCGFAAWRDRSASVEPAPCDVAPNSRLDVLLWALFATTASPITLDAVVGWVATLTGLQPRPEVGIDDDHVEPDFAAATEARDLLAHVWSEICQLNEAQRVALLLNLRDAAGDAATPLLVVTGIASIEQIAEVLGLPPLEFAAIFNDLPLNDHAIASLLGVTRQQVINLRSAARKRLARRMSHT